MACRVGVPIFLSSKGFNGPSSLMPVQRVPTPSGIGAWRMEQEQEYTTVASNPYNPESKLESKPTPKNDKKSLQTLAMPELLKKLALSADGKDTIDLVVIGGVKDDKKLKSFQVQHFHPLNSVRKHTKATVKRTALTLNRACDEVGKEEFARQLRA
jgi:hypothetical protein